MAIDVTYTWTFNPLESYPTASGENDVVFLIHWQLYGYTGSLSRAQNPNAVVYDGSAIGTQKVTYESGSTFIPFNELTYNTVYNWMTASMGIEKMNEYTASVYQQIDDKINPPILVQQAPWL